MPRPCYCDNTDVCKFCRLYYEDDSYRKRCDGVESFPQRALNFLRAVTEEIKWRSSGGAAPTKEEKELRRKICNECERRDSGNDSCLECGCYLEANLLHIPPLVFGKLDCSTQQCPMKKWGPCGGYAKKGCCGS